MHWPWFWELDISGKLTHCSMAYVSRAVVNVFAYCNYIDLTKTEVHELTKPYITLALIHNSLNTALEYIYPFLEFTRSSICLTQIRFISCNWRNNFSNLLLITPSYLVEEDVFESFQAQCMLVLVASLIEKPTQGFITTFWIHCQTCPQCINLV